MASKDRDRIRQLREEANALRKKEEARKRRSRMFAQLGIVAGAVVVIAAIVLLVVMGPKWFSNQIAPSAEGEVELTNSAGEAVSLPIRVEEDGGVVVGSDDAPAKLDYYFDFSCPHCQDYHTAMESSYEQVLADGDVQVTYHMIRFVQDYGQYAGSAVAGVISADPSLFYTVMSGIFSVPAETQVTWGYSDYASYVQTLGFTDEEVIQNIADGNYGGWISDNTERAREDGISGTPSVGVNGTLLETVPASLDELLDAIGAEPAATTDSTTEPTATAESTTEPTATTGN